MSYNEHQSPEHDQAQQMTEQMTGLGKKAGNKAGQVAKKAGKKVASKVGKKVLQIGAKAMAKVGMAIAQALASAVAFLLPYILGILAVSIILVAIWYVVYEERGTKQDYAMDSKVEANEMEAVFKEGEGFSTKAKSLSGENQAVKEFYNYFGSKRSYWQIKGNDNTKLIKGDDEEAVRDHYRKEDQYSINPNFLFALDEFVFKREFRFPEQFVEPVQYDPKKLTLKQLTDGLGTLTAESVKYDKKGMKTDEKVKGVWDYGFASIFKYKKDHIIRTVEGKYTSKQVWSEAEKKVVTVEINEPFVEVMDGYPLEIDLMTHAITFAGDYTFEYEDKKSQVGGAEGQLKDGTDSSKTNQAVKSILYDTYDEYEEVPVMGDVTYTEKETKVIWVEEAKQVPVYEWVMYPYPHQELVGYDTVVVWVQKTIEVTVTKTKREQVSTEKKFVKTHKLYKFREGAVYETIPVEKPKVDNSTEEEKKKKEKERLRYLEDYLFYFKSYVPKSVMEKFDFEGRVGSIIATDMTLGGTANFNNGNYAGAMQHYDLVKYHSEKYGVEPEAIIAMIAQESGGKANREDGLMQITGDNKKCSGTPPTGPEVCVYSEADRQDPDKAIAWGVANFAVKLAKYNGDYLKAMQSHNLDPQWIFKTYPETENTLDWLNYREEMRIHYGQQELHALTRSINYSCIPGFDESSVAGRDIYGDVCYLENVLRYYTGNMITGVDKVDTPSESDSFKDKVINAIKGFFGIAPKEYMEDEERFKFEHKMTAREVDHLLRSIKTFNEKISFSRVDETSEIDFWEKGFGTAGSGKNLSKEEFLALVGDAEYVPPLADPNPRVTSVYGEMRGSKAHRGLDIGVKTGTPLYAVQDGVVDVAVNNQTHSKQSWGNYVKLKLKDGNYVLYAHMNYVDVSVGQKVEQGQYLGDSGNSGDSTGPHLHFEFYYQSPLKSALTDPTWIVVQPDLFK